MRVSTVRVGVIGTTEYAQGHMARISAHPAADVVAVAGRDPGRTRAAGDRFGARAYMSFEELLNPALVDAVAVVAPDALHEQICVAALRAGLHVLCEKPLGRTAAEAERMASAAAGSGLVNMSYFNLRTTAAHRTALDIVRSGRIGTVRRIELGIEHGMFLSDRYDWRFDARRGGGVVADLGCYLFDLARLFVGEVAAIAADGASFITRPDPGGAYEPAPDSCAGALRFTGGAHGTFQASAVSHVAPGFQHNRFVLDGDAGRLELHHDFDSASLRLLPHGAQEFEQIGLAADAVIPAGDDEFIDAVLAGRPVSPDFSDGLQVQRIVEAAEAATRSRRWEPVVGAHIEEGMTP